MGMALAVARPACSRLSSMAAVLHEGRHERTAFLVGGAAFALAEVVERETRITLPREPPRLAFHEVVAPVPGVIDEHGGPRSRL